MKVRPATPMGSPDRRPAIWSVALAGAAVAATVGGWLVLAAMTGLIYHFLPGATFLAASSVFRTVERGRRASIVELVAILVASGLGTATGLLVVPALGRELDSPMGTALVVVAGALVATVWLRRRTTEVGASGLGGSRDR